MTPPASAPLSAQGHARLLDLALARVRFSVQALPFVALPFVGWQWARAAAPPWLLLAWVAAYALAIWGMQRVIVRWRAQCAAQGPAAAVARWRGRLRRLALLNGLGIGLLPVLVALGQQDESVRLLALAAVSAILAANATHLTPDHGAFVRLLAVAWGLNIALLPWTQPRLWAIGGPLMLIYAVALLRHGRIAHGFYLQQVRLEEAAADLAERHRRASEAAHRALADKSLFLATASHDLRQPVQAMGLLAEAAVARNQDPALAGALHDLRLAARAVHLMLNAVLDLARIERRSGPPPREPVDVAALLLELVTLFQAEAAAHHLALRARMPRGGAVVMADAMLLRQALTNLVHNALRYTTHGGVLLAARRRARGWRIEVWDSGIGVPLSEHAAIFSPLYRQAHAWQVDHAGHGLGLAVVARCAQRMGATHGLMSRPGHGSCFWLHLPDTDGGIVPAPTAAPSPAPLAPLQGRALLVDDDAFVRQAWLTLTRAWGLDARAAAAGAEALAWLDAGWRPQAVLCDQRLQDGESGFALLAALLARCPEASGALVTGEPAAPVLREAEEQGYLVLAKPIAPAELHALLAAWLALA